VVPRATAGDQGAGAPHGSRGPGRPRRGDRHRPTRPVAVRDFQLGKSLGLPAIGPIDEGGRYHEGFGWLSRKDAPNVAQEIVDDLERRGFFYHLEAYSHRYPHCWRCETPLLFRLVDEWYISMGPVYDKPRDQVTAAEVDASLRYQIMEIVDRIRWIPDFGYERELDWLLNMHDWMISKKRYWGLALPIYDCQACGSFDVVGGREELRERAVEGWGAFEGHTPHRPHVDAVRIACSSCGAPVERIADVGNPWLDAGIVPFSTLHYREAPDYWADWFPADFVTESFPGQFRNWFYSMLAMSGVLRRESRQDDLRLRHAPLRRGRPADAKAGATRSSSTRRPSGWAST
jgi:isoleucyl-tRNA synthetase